MSVLRVKAVGESERERESERDVLFQFSECPAGDLHVHECCELFMVNLQGNLCSMSFPTYSTSVIFK